MGAGLVLKEIRRFLSTALPLFTLPEISVPVRSHWSVDALEPGVIPSMFVLTQKSTLIEPVILTKVIHVDGYVYLT